MEEKEIRKPPFLLSFQLYLFTMLTIWNYWGLISNLNGYWWDRINLIPISQFICVWIVDFFAYTYAMVAIYKALQCRPYSITMLKFSVVYTLIQTLFRSINHVGGQIPLLPFFYVPIVLFCGIVLLYLFRSRKLEAYLPALQRKFGAYGFGGVAIYLAVVALYIYAAIPNIMREQNSAPIERECVQLNPNELTDGLTIMKPLDSWELDSILGNQDERVVFIFKKNDSHIAATAFHADCQNRVDFCAIVSEMYMAFFPDTISVKEVAYKDTVTDRGKYYSNTYEILSYKKQPTFWTISAIMDKDSYKVQALSYLEKGGYQNSVRESKDFMNGIDFKLKQRIVMHESVDQVENSSDNNKLEDKEQKWR